MNNNLGYMICEIIDSIDNETHTLFIGKLIEYVERLEYYEYSFDENDISKKIINRRY